MANRNQLKQIDNYVFLRGSISTNEGSVADINKRIGAVQSPSKIGASKEMNKAAKKIVYETLVLSVLMYNSETWT